MVACVCHYIRMHADSDTPSAEDIATVAEIFAILADPTRVGLLHVLVLEGGELSVGTLARALDRPQAGISQHLARLRMAHLVTTRRQGTQVLYQLANEHVGQLVADALRHAEHLGPGVPAHHRTSDG